MAWWTYAIIGAIVLLIIGLYNSLIRLRNKVKNAWAQIDVQLKKRFDLIPNLVDTVKGYAKHEKGVLTEITKARNMMKQAKGVKDKAAAENQLSGALKSLFAVSENYPDLKASQNFLQLQEELSGMESKIAYARQFYNDMVMRFNTKIQVFPTNMIAKILGFNENQFFETKGKQRENVKVKF
jgi:LemA protein